MVGGVEDEIINVEADVAGGSNRRVWWNVSRSQSGRGIGQRRKRWRGFLVSEDAGVEAWVMFGGRQAHILEDTSNHVVPVVWRSSESIQSFVEKPIFIAVEGRVANWRTDDSGFILRQYCIAKSILAITLLEYASISNSLGGEEAE